MFAFMATFMKGLAAEDLCQTHSALHITDDCQPLKMKSIEPGGGSGSGGRPVWQGGPPCEPIAMTYCTMPGYVRLEVAQDDNVADWLVSF